MFNTLTPKSRAGKIFSQKNNSYMINKFKISSLEIVVLTPISEDRAAGTLNSLRASQPRNCNSIPSSDKFSSSTKRPHCLSDPSRWSLKAYRGFCHGSKAAGT